MLSVDDYVRTNTFPYVSQVIAATLATQTAQVFGLMGNGNAYFIEALSEHGVKYTSMRHEAGAVSAADTYHRISRRLAVATVTYGAGFTNTITALQEAQMAATPMVLVAGDAPMEGARPWDADQIRLSDAIGVTTFRVQEADTAGDTAAAAIEQACDSLQPVVLSIPSDLGVRGVEKLPGSSSRVQNGLSAPRPEQVLLRRASALIGAAKTPLILAGRGALLSDAKSELHDLAEQIGALTATTLLAQGLFGDSSTDLGVAGGFGRDWALERIYHADVVLVVGARLNQFTLNMGTLIDPNATVIQVDLFEESAHPRTNIFLQGDAKAVANMLSETVAALEVQPGWRSTYHSECDAQTPDSSPVPEHRSDGRLDPRAVASALDTMLPPDRVLVHDLGNFVEWMHTRTHLPGPGRCTMIGSAFQSIGLGLSGFLGASAAVSESTVVLATGDGGLLMALADLESVVREVSSGVIVVFNDAAYGAEVHQYASYGLDAHPMLTADVDFANVAKSMGAQAHSIRNLADLDVVRSWNESGAGGVLLLDCKVSRSVASPVLEGIARKIERPSQKENREKNEY